MTNKLFKTTALVGMLFAFGGSSALAQSPADEVYNPNGGVLDVVESGTPTPTPAPETGTAPETTSEAPAAAEDDSTAAAPATPAATATPSTETQQAAAGDLPFTGFEAGFVALAGMALLAGGFAMRRATRHQ